jgi:hypothetical protein
MRMILTTPYMHVVDAVNVIEAMDISSSPGLRVKQRHDQLLREDMPHPVDILQIHDRPGTHRREPPVFYLVDVTQHPDRGGPRD